MDTTNSSQLPEMEGVGLKKILVDYIRQWKVFAVAFVIALVVAILYLLLVPKTWESTAQFQLQQNEATGGGGLNLGEASGLIRSMGFGGGGGAGLNIDDEKVIVMSHDLMSKVVTSLGLNIEYYKPYTWNYKLYDNSPLLLTCDSVTTQRLSSSYEFKVKVAANGKTKVKVKSKTEKKTYSFEYPSLPADIPLKQGTFTLNYSPEHQDRNSSISMTIKAHPVGMAAEFLLEEVMLDDYSKSANILILNYLDYEPQRAIDLLGSMLRYYNELDKEYKQTIALSSERFIDGRIENIFSQLQSLDTDIKEYREDNEVMYLETDVQFYISQLTELRSKLLVLETDIHVVSLLDQFIKEAANKYNLIPAVLSTQGGGDSNSLITAYNNMLLERINLLKSSTAESPLVVQLDKQLDRMRESVSLSIANSQQGLEKTRDELKGKEKTIMAKMGSVPAKEKDLTDIAREYEILQSVYLYLLQKKEEIALSVGNIKDRIRVVDQPYVKAIPVAPRKLYAAIIVMLMTMILPVAWIELRKLYKEIKKELKKKG